jgi:hypothetical protein
MHGHNGNVGENRRPMHGHDGVMSVTTVPMMASGVREGGYRGPTHRNEGRRQRSDMSLNHAAC